MSKVAILGYGTVGSGIYDVLTTNSDEIAKNAGEPVEVKYVLDLREFPGDPVGEVLVHDFDVILHDPEVSVVAEAMGGLKPAYSFAKAALEAGKSYCTSNKELVEAYGADLIATAAAHNCNFLFEASVGGGIPILRPLRESLTSDRILAITGILNGTTNYILTNMASGKKEFGDALAEAQQLGYAERDPSADIAGGDAARKIAILASLAFGKDVHFTEVYTEGIENIHSEDFLYAKKLGMAIKLLSDTRTIRHHYYACVAPMLVDMNHPLYAVNSVYNGIMVQGNKVGLLMFFGSGAGKLPTASAVVSDIVEAVKNPGRHLSMHWSEEKLELSDFKTSMKRFLVRISGSPEEKKSICEKLFAPCKYIEVEELTGEFGVLTRTMSETEFEEAAAQVPGLITRIRLA